MDLYKKGTGAKNARVGIFEFGFVYWFRMYRNIQVGNWCKKCTGWVENVF